VEYPVLTSKSKLLLILIMFFAFIPDFKLYLCPKNLSKAKPSDCAIPNYLYYAINDRLFTDM